jgi:hypothetical protein
MRGCSGNDFYWVNASSDTVIENANDRLDTVSASANFKLGINAKNLGIRAKTIAIGLTEIAIAGVDTSISNEYQN